MPAFSNTIPGEAAKAKGHASYPEDFPHLRPGESFTAWLRKYAVYRIFENRNAYLHVVLKTDKSRALRLPTVYRQ